mmetsp:Transcript_12962/g.16362  ORF Transcript_12962/g.16362 Transcript_12962/m.16362 type:complete len:149 (+) Transcript_12962:3-449(+)|eukprot:CAMPEP_0172505236 /NCGR_PEP_ID=MMETSP1066-20121228/184741_1 /TAXON_ID=671091 /ORGANISM="Coscinodiscus wailesii, Strain CCMP2513" /LENGTH=148 /DNA_ID=CAMNT_0013281763 /DNA_START=1 /DNA_END=447 /DNA_ORIENTATION=+
MGSWGEGDECYSWFHTGQVTLDYKGVAVLKEFSPDKFAIEFHGEGTITVVNHKPYEIPMYIGFMAFLKNYPPTRLYFEDGTVELINTLNAHVPGHINRMQRVGVAKPGKNIIRIQPNMDKKLYLLPFRLTKVVLCNAGTYEVVNPALN